MEFFHMLDAMFTVQLFPYLVGAIGLMAWCGYGVFRLYDYIYWRGFQIGLKPIVDRLYAQAKTEGFDISEWDYQFRETLTIMAINERGNLERYMKLVKNLETGLYIDEVA